MREKPISMNFKLDVYLYKVFNLTKRIERIKTTKNIERNRPKVNDRDNPSLEHKDAIRTYKDT